MYLKISFFKFQQAFSTDKKCWDYLYKKRWPDGFICPKCECRNHSFIRTRKLLQCKGCRYQCSVTANTIFHKSRIPLWKLFWMLYFLGHDKNGHSALDFSRKLEISYKCAWSMCHKIRKAMQDRDAKYKLAGVIELDDAFFGGKKVTGPRGRGAKGKVSTLVGAQVNNGKPQYASMTVVDEISSESVKKVAKATIAEGSTVKSDGLNALRALGKAGYNHLPEVIGDPKNASKVLPWVHIFIANSKSIIRGTYKGISLKYTQRYLSEFCYRLNRRFDVDQIFDRLLLACILREPITLAELRA